MSASVQGHCPGGASTTRRRSVSDTQDIWLLALCLLRSLQKRIHLTRKAGREPVIPLWFQSQVLNTADTNSKRTEWSDYNQ